MSSAALPTGDLDIAMPSDSTLLCFQLDCQVDDVAAMRSRAARYDRQPTSADALLDVHDLIGHRGSTRTGGALAVDSAARTAVVEQPGVEPGEPRQHLHKVVLDVGPVPAFSDLDWRAPGRADQAATPYEHRLHRAA
ncbi:hypothetical protein ACIBJE_04030 [Micromonospora sp. NPDC050187]|uniref:hypothetical protein n=1 Tax=Micromonospora sp. NPDC050187 TaxID=3364277 RepID=UPI0037AC1EAF